MYPRYVNVSAAMQHDFWVSDTARKEETDVGWCLRADLHHDVDPSSLLLRASPVLRERCGGVPVRDQGRVQGAQGGLASAIQCAL
jgi:hypothetical protein